VSNTTHTTAGTYANDSWSFTGTANYNNIGSTAITDTINPAAAPTVTGVTSTTANGTYGAGSVITPTVSFSEAVNVTGTPQLALNSGGTASYSSGSGTSTLTFTYTVAAGQNANPLDESSTGALTLNGGTIQNSAGNAANLTLPASGAPGSLGANSNIVINTTGPTNISSDLNVTVGGHHLIYLNGVRYVEETLTITNTSNLTFASGFTLVLNNLSTNASLYNKNGTYQGDPYINVATPAGGLAPNQSLTVDLIFLDPTLQPIAFGNTEYDGTMSGNS
jgi:large repetitive protein